MLSERKIRKINEHLDEHIAKNSIQTARLGFDPEPFSRTVSPYQELMEEATSLTSQNLVSLGNFLSNSQAKAQGYYKKIEHFIGEITKRQYEMKKDFGGPEVDLLLGKLKHLRRWLQQKI